MSRRLFITRPLGPEAPLRKKLEEERFELSGHSMLQFEAIEVAEIKSTQWLFAYSPRGINYLLDQQLVEQKDQRLFNKGEELKLAAVGPGTAEAWQEEGLMVDFIGDSEPASTATAFAKTHCQDAKPNVTF